MAHGLRKILRIISFPHFLSLLTEYTFDIWYIALLYQVTNQIEIFFFDPLIFYEYMALGLRKILQIVIFMHFCSPLPALQSWIVTNQNLVLLC
jgi:hypothetical protein